MVTGNQNRAPRSPSAVCLIPSALPIFCLLELRVLEKIDEENVLKWGTKLCIAAFMQLEDLGRSWFTRTQINLQRSGSFFILFHGESIFLGGSLSTKGRKILFFFP